MKIHIKYILYLFIISLFESLIILFQSRQVASYSLAISCLFIFGVFIYRYIYCWNSIFKYIKGVHPFIFKKHTFRLFSIIMKDRFALQDPEVINNLNLASLNLVKEIRVLQRYFIISFFLFFTFSLIIVKCKNF